MNIMLSRHAKEQARERGITVEEIKKAIQRGAKHLQPEGKIVSDYAYIRIVYRKANETDYIITVMVRR